MATVRFNPSLQTYAIESLGRAAAAILPASLSAKAGSSWFFEGQSQTGNLDFTRKGPFDGDWIANPTSPLGASKLIWKPCGFDRALPINIRMLVSPSGSDHAFSQLKILAVKIKRWNCLYLGFQPRLGVAA